MTEQRIPAGIWKRLWLFLRDERSGSITLHVRSGRVQNAVIAEHVKHRESEPRKSADVLHSR